MKACVGGLLMLLVGCSQLGDDQIFTALPDAEPRLQPNISSIQDNIFLFHCSCHRAFEPAGLMSLKRGEEVASLVNVPVNCSTATAVRVIPGDPDNSYLITKLAAHTEGGALDCGDPMPVRPVPITQEELDIVRLWIEMGANP